MEKGLGDFEKSRPFILTTILETSLLLEPGSRLVEVLIENLLAARRPYGDLLLWPEKAEPLLIAPEPVGGAHGAGGPGAGRRAGDTARPARCRRPWSRPRPG